MPGHYPLRPVPRCVLTKRLKLYFYEELGWLIIFLANTAASAFLYARADTPAGRLILLQLNLLFGAGYLPWQVFHLRSLRGEARAGPGTPVRWQQGVGGLEACATRSTSGTRGLIRPPGAGASA